MEVNNTQFVFFGTPSLATIVLDELEKEGFIPDLVITAPDRKQGRGMKLQEPQVKVWAKERGIEVWQPQSLDGDVAEKLKERGYSFGIVAAYGKIIPQEFIDIFEKGILNVHPSLLPFYRGASPIRSQILNDEKEVGVTIMLMDEKLDHGPILSHKKVELEVWPPHGSKLENLLAHEGGKLLAHTIPGWLEGEIDPVPQNHEKATYVKKITKEDGEISLEDDSYKNFLKIRAFDIWPRTYIFFTHKGEKKRAIISKAVYEDGELHIQKVIPEGKSEMTWSDFQNMLKS